MTISGDVSTNTLESVVVVLFSDVDVVVFGVVALSLKQSSKVH